MYEIFYLTNQKHVLKTGKLIQGVPRKTIKIKFTAERENTKPLPKRKAKRRNETDKRYALLA